MGWLVGGGLVDWVDEIFLIGKYFASESYFILLIQKMPHILPMTCILQTFHPNKFLCKMSINFYHSKVMTTHHNEFFPQLVAKVLINLSRCKTRPWWRYYQIRDGSGHKEHFP